MDNYDASKIEEKWRKYWEKEQIYRFDEKSKKPVYSIDTPPPYASSGLLHVGHALHYTQFEIIARIRRLLGYEVYFAPGFDDNGLPTEKYVEEKFGIDKNKVNREEFRKICLEESKKVEKEYSDRVFKRLGHSFDWSLLYTTISSQAQKIAQTVFLRLNKKGDCYRSKEPVIWCTKHETALAQAEVEDLTRTTKLNYIDFDIIREKNKITIATTRPEFLPACVAIFVNPKDKKNNGLIGKKLKVPIFEHEVEVKADDKVDPGFGTGIVMICTFGDTSDIEGWKNHKLPLKIVINEKGRMINSGRFDGLKVNEAREKIVEELKETGRLKKQEAIQQTVGSCWRCSTPVEYIVADQWFIKTLKYKKELIKRGREIKWHPEFMRTRYENWIKGLSWDWIISRQRYYGIAIPCWYCECGEIIFPEEEELPLDPLFVKKKCPKCGKQARGDSDVFDTWMTSSNSPELAAKWLENPPLYKKIAPMSLRPQSHDIIRSWAFYTILKSHVLFNRIPWKEVMIGTFVLDPKGKGMHKSKGNAVWADDIIEKYGVDAFRYWVASASLGSDLPFKEQELVAGKKFLTKLWNASKFTFMNIKDYKNKPKILEKTDILFLQQLSQLIDTAKKLYEQYNIAEARRKTETFFWHVFCDNYLELVKQRIYQGSKEEKASAQYTLYSILLAILKLMAPITPFITEEIYQSYFKKHEKDKSIHISSWPTQLKIKTEKTDEEVFNLLIETISKVREEKAKAQKSIKAEIILTIEPEKIKRLEQVKKDLQAVLNAREIKTGNFGVEFV